MENTTEQFDAVKHYNILCREYAENPNDELLKKIDLCVALIMMSKKYKDF
tara:strand:+ start:72 stop:221 length:150 start_codon:yes stop_codon:yes gene_type:complete